jgi:hypothetical protein
MPSNTTATSPGGIYRSLQARKPFVPRPESVAKIASKSISLDSICRGPAPKQFAATVPTVNLVQNEFVVNHHQYIARKRLTELSVLEHMQPGFLRTALTTSIAPAVVSFEAAVQDQKYFESCEAAKRLKELLNNIGATDMLVKVKEALEQAKEMAQLSASLQPVPHARYMKTLETLAALRASMQLTQLAFAQLFKSVSWSKELLQGSVNGRGIATCLHAR